MPTYEYVCEKCGHQFELSQRMSDPPLKTCPKELCGRKKWGRGRVKKSISAGGGLLFKGSGFYTTDYRSDSYKQAEKTAISATHPAATTPTKAEPKTDSKPAAKPAPKADKK